MTRLPTPLDRNAPITIVRPVTTGARWALPALACALLSTAFGPGGGLGPGGGPGPGPGLALAIAPDAPGAVSSATPSGGPKILGATGDGPAVALPNLQAPPAAFDGTDVTIAVIGSGIDYTHEAFGGSGDPEAFASNDPRTTEPGTFPHGAVVGGYDFAGEIYSSACPSPAPADVECAAEPTADDDPLDRAGGLGSAIAGVALEAAPGASLVALKIFGQPDGVPAESTLHARALEWVLAHNRGEDVPGARPEGRIDVVLDSGGGGRWSARWAELNAVVDALAADGVTVVAPAGDDGPTPFVVGGVGATDAAIAVAAVIARGEQVWGIRAEWAGEDDVPVVREHEALDALAPLGTVAGSDPIVAPLAWYGLACAEDDGSPSEPAQDVRERIALVERGVCPFVDKLQSAEAMGAVAVLFFTDTRPTTRPQGGGGGAPAIPSAMIDRAPGQELQALLEAGTAISVTLDAGYEFRKTWLDGTLHESTSRGPSRLQGAHLERRVAAPGVDIPAVEAGSGAGLSDRTGSAIAAGAVAGAAARVAQRLGTEPSARPGDVAALLINTADPIVHIGRNDTGPLAPVSLQGAGLVDVERALRSRLVMVSDHDSGLPFDPVHTVMDFEGLTWQRVSNLGAEARTVRFDFVPAAGAPTSPGITITRAAELVEIPAGGSSELEIRVGAALDDFPAWSLDDGNPIDDEAAFGATEFGGWLEIREVDPAGSPIAGGDVARLPFSTIRRQPSRIERVGGDAADGGVVTLHNAGPGGGAVVPAVAAGRDARDVTAPWPSPAALDILSVGVRHGPDPGASPDEADPDTLVEWRIQTLGPRILPAETAFDILLDLDRDGRFDRIVTSLRGPDAGRGLDALEWYAVTTYLKPGTLEPELSRMRPDPIPIEWDLLESTTALRARAEDLLLDLPSGDEAFDFAVRTRDPLRTSPAPLALDREVFDTAPDGLDTGARFRFDQSVHDCLGFEHDDGTPIRGLGAEGQVALPPGSTASIRLRWSCGAPPVTAAGDPIEALLALAGNVRNAHLPPEPETQVVAIPVLGPASGDRSIYLPQVRR